jgi:GH25 family lysozyme M1 (1,4-beta-N-acetylmuramidase)
LGKENTNEGDSTIDNRRVEEVSTDAAVDVKDNSGVSNVVSETDNADKSVDNSETKGEDAGVASGDWNADNISLNQIPLSFLILFAVGWILPSPAVIVRGIGSVILFFRDLITGKI